MNKTLQFLLTGAMALAACVLVSCGGSKDGVEPQDSGLRTDGVLGELPKLTADWYAYHRAYNNYSNNLLQKGATEKEAEEFQKKREEHKAAEKQYNERRKEIIASFVGKEFPIEAAEGLPLKFDGGVARVSDKSTTQIKVVYSGEFTADKASPWRDGGFGYVPVAMSADGKPLHCGGGEWLRVADMTGAKAGTRFECTYNVVVADNNAERMVDFAKIVIVDNTTEQGKALLDQISADTRAVQEAWKAEKEQQKQE